MGGQATGKEGREGGCAAATSTMTACKAAAARYKSPSCQNVPRGRILMWIDLCKVQDDMGGEGLRTAEIEVEEELARGLV